jgi:hypothetical protein
MHRSLLVFMLPLVSLGLGCNKKGWDWREHFVVECMVLPDLAEVSVNGRDLPDGTVVSSPELPELEDTINPSGVYMVRASLVPLPVGSTTLNFEARSGDETAKTSCTIDRPVFPAVANPVLAETAEFVRAFVSYTLVAAGSSGEPELRGNVVGVDPSGGTQRRYLLPFQAWKPQNVQVDGQPITASDTGVIEVPIPAEPGKSIQLRFDNPDKQSADYTVTLVEARPWADADAAVLVSGAEGGYAWASEIPQPRAPGSQINALLVAETGEVRGRIGTMVTLADVQRVARMTETEEVVEVCDYGTPDGLTAKITRVAIKAEIVLRDAKTGTEVARTTVTGKPDKCPDSADFTFVETEGKDGQTSFDQMLVGDALPAAEAWFTTASQK